MSGIKGALALGAAVATIGYATTSTTSTTSTETMSATSAAKTATTTSATTTAATTTTSVPAGYTVRYARDFGIMCDGVKDDTVALQNALSSLKGYQALQLPAGTCLTSKELKVYAKSNVLVAGAGKDSTILQAKDPAHSSFIVNLSSNVLLKDFQVYAPTSTSRLSYGVTTKGFFVTKSSGVTLDSVKARNVSGAGILLNSVSNSMVLNSEVDRSWADAFHVTGRSQNVLFQYNSTSGAGDDCFASIGYGTDINRSIRFYDNSCSDNKASGVSFEGTDGGQAYRNRLVRTGVAALRVASQKNWNTAAVSNIDLRDNVVLNSNTRANVVQGAIMVYSTYRNISNISFTNTTVTDPYTTMGTQLINYVAGQGVKISGVSFSTTPIKSSDGRVKRCFAISGGGGVSVTDTASTLNSLPCKAS